MTNLEKIETFNDEIIADILQEFPISRQMKLRTRFISIESRAFVDMIFSFYLSNNPKMRVSSESKARRALGVVSAEILCASALGQTVHRALCRNSFTKDISYSFFVKTISFLIESDLIGELKGSSFGKNSSHLGCNRIKTKFYALPRLWEVANNLGIEREKLLYHFDINLSNEC